MANNPTATAAALRHRTTSGATSANDDLANLDFLRATAVLLVLLGHLTYFMGFTEIGPLATIRMGAMGVGMFFVHTCLVLMLSLERQWKASGNSRFFSSFMVRRIFRIYPLSLVIVFIVVIFRLPMAGITPQHFFGLRLHPSLIVANALLVQHSGHSILGPMWSLSYEMAMYLLLPALFRVLYPNKSYWRIAAIWTIAVVACLIFLGHMRQTTADYFLLYVPYFLPGLIAYQLQRSPKFRLPSLLWPVFVMGIILIFLSKRNLIENGWHRMWIFCLAFGIGIPFFRQISARWLTAPSHLIAKYSYGIYLTHFLCIWLTLERLHGVLSRSTRLCLFVVLVVSLPVIFYHFLEEPMILVGKRLAKRLEVGFAGRLPFVAQRISS